MKFIDNILYLEFSEVVECGVKEETIKKAKLREGNCWTFIDDPADKRKVLIGYEGMKDMYKKLVLERWGNPYDRMARLPILKMVELDYKANEYYKQYRYSHSPALHQGDGGNKYLPIDTVNKYTRAASWLGMVNRVMGDKSIVKKGMGISLDTFDDYVDALVAEEKKRGELEGYAGLDVLPGNFPASAQRLKAKAVEYKALMQAGDDSHYKLLISPLFGNKIASKLGKTPTPKGELADGITMELMPFGGAQSSTKLTLTGGNDQKSVSKGGAFDPELYERQMAVIRAISRKHNNFDAAQVAEMANLLFELNGWKTVSVATVRRIMNENKHTLTAGRRGKREYMDKVAMQNKRKAPPYPMVYWTMDGWTAELMYQERGVDSKGNAKTDYKRLVLVVVLDAMNKYPVGYAIGDRENTALIRQACRNALGHVYELLGGMYYPMQLQSDRYQVKNLTPFYQAVAGLYTPAEAKNAKAKVIEPYFRYLNKKYAQLTEFWTGFNLDSKKTNQVNREWLDQIKGHAPDRDGAIKQLERMMSRERALKHDVYMAKWAELPECDKHVMSEMNYLRTIGTQLGDRTCKTTGQGIIKQIDGVAYTYDSFDPAFRANMHIDWQLWGDKANLSKVLAVSPDEKIKFVLEEKRLLPMDIYSTTQEDVDNRMRVKHFNKDRMAEITELTGRDADMVRDIVENTPFNLSDDAENDLKLLLTYNGQQKEKLQDAKGLRQGRRLLEKALVTEQQQAANDWKRRRQEFLDDMLDDM